MLVSCLHISPWNEPSIVKNTLLPTLIAALLASSLLAQQPNPLVKTNRNPVNQLDQPSLVQRVSNDGLDQQQPFTLAHAEDLAFRNNPTLARATARVHAAWGRLVQAGLYPNTVIGYHAMEVGNLGTSGGQGGFVQQTVVTGGKLHLDQTIAAHQLNGAEVELTSLEQRVLNDVRIRYFDLLVAQRRVELINELVRIASAFVESTETLLKSRRVNENTLLQAQLEADNSQILLDNARNAHQESWRRLQMVLGNPRLPLQRAVGDLDTKVETFEWQESLRLLMSDHPDITAAQIRVDQAQATLHRACRERYPNIDVMVSLRHNNMTSNDVANIQVGFPLPLFDRNQGNIMRAQAELSAAQSQVEQVELELTDQFAVIFRQYKNSHQQVLRYRDQMLPRARKSLDYVTRGYREGQVDFLTLLTSQRTYYQVTLQLLNARRLLRESEILMSGQLLRDSLRVHAPHIR